jgi:hypothetical protein
MGEAKDREKLGLSRKVHVYDAELLDFVTYFVARQPVAGGQPGAPRVTSNFDDRKRTRAMLKQLGAYEMYMKITSKVGGGLMVSEISPTPRVVEMTVESIDYFLSQIREVPVDQAMRICELEDRFNQAKLGLYEVPDELRTPEPAPAPLETVSAAPPAQA